MIALDPKALAIAAAAQATEAATELLRFAREGEGLNGIYEVDVIEKLLDATKMAIEATGERGGEHSAIYGDIAGTLEFWA
ncbi:MAG: hypothetical protein QHC90_25740 [Shinella sp.]|nr:hypothetical protein [Shinella sp.]